MRLALGLTMGSGSRGSLLRSFSSAQYNASTGLFALPSWLTIACATTGRTTRDSAATVKAGFGANAARGRDVGNGPGLSVEQASTVGNTASATNVGSTGWTSTGAVITANQAAAPDGTTTAALLDLTGGGVYPSSGLCVAGTIYSGSVWLRTVSGTGTVNLTNAQTTVGTATHSITTAWKLCDLAEAAPNAAPGAPWIRRTSGVTTYYAWGEQYTTGKIPGSFNNAASRAADVLTCPSASSIAPGGFFNVIMTVAPNYATAEQVADHDLLYFDTNNRLFIQQSTGKIVLRIGGADVLSSALTWSRDQGLTIAASHRAGGRSLTVTGATSGNGAATGGAASAISLPGSLGVLGNGTTTQESADLRAFTVLKP